MSGVSELRALVVLAIAFVLVGCAEAAAPSGSASANGEPGGSGGPPLSACPEVDLRKPNGEPLDVTGTWLGNDDSYWTFTQVAGCVWATATDRYESLGAAAVYWQIYMRGLLQPDFTIPVEYAYSPLSDILESHYGHAVLSIEFGDQDGALVLRKTAGCTGAEDDTCPPGTGTLQTTSWSLVSAAVLLPPPTPLP